MESTIQKLEEGRVALTVLVAQPELKEHIARVEQEALSEIQVDGFRKGKAPEDVGRQQLDQAKVLQAALEEALEFTMAKAIAEHDLDVFRATELKIQENSADQLKYSVNLTLYPKADLPDLKQFSVERKEVSATDADVDETITVIRDSRATFTPKEGAAATGDRVEVDFQVRNDGTIIEGGESKNHPLIIGGKNFMPGFEDQLIGMKKDETKEFSLKVPADYYHKDIAGKNLDFTVTMKSVQNVVKPEVTDDFAKLLGKFENLTQLKVGIREGITEEKKQKEQQRVRLAALDQITSKMNVVFAEPFIEDQLDGLVANFERDLAERSMELGMYLAQIGKTRDELRKDWRPEAERQAKISFVIHKVAQQENLKATPQEIGEALNQQIQALASRGPIDPSQIDLTNARRTVADQLTNEKALAFIERTCVKT